MDAKDRIFVALDTDLWNAENLVRVLRDHVGGFKIGLELTLQMFSIMIAPSSGEEALGNFRQVRQFFSMLDRGKMFWDLKFNDIPNTIAGATKAIQPMQVCFFNVHASAGVEGMMAAAANKGSSFMLAVTVLTSFEENNANQIFGGPTKAKVLQFARYAKLAGCDGIVLSPQELLLLRRQKELAGLLRVTPGIRDVDAEPDDQRRTMAADEAIKAGADYLVIGRPITGAPNPVEAAKKFASKISSALEAMSKAA